MALLTRSLAAVFLLSCGVAALPACGSSSSDGSGGSAGSSGSGGSGGSSGSSGTGGSGGATIQCQEPGSSLTLSGTWAAKVRMSVGLTAQPGGPVTICPVDQPAEATLYLLFDVQQNASDPTKLDAVQAHVCSVELPQVTGKSGTCDPNDANLVKTQLVLPQALTDALPTIQVDPVTATLDGSAPGAMINTAKVLFVAGSSKPAPGLPSWDTSTPACATTNVGRTNQCEPTCVKPDCSALRDDDGDGFPGITLDVCGRTPSDVSSNLPCNTDDPSQPGTTIQGRAWLDLQIDPTLTGTVKSSCEITGNVDASIQYNVVGADVTLSNGVLAVTSAIQSLPAFDVKPADSVYRMIRVDGQYGAPDWSLGSDPSAACATLLSSHHNDF